MSFSRTTAMFAILLLVLDNIKMLFSSFSLNIICEHDILSLSIFNYLPFLFLACCIVWAVGKSRLDFAKYDTCYFFCTKTIFIKLYILFIISLFTHSYTFLSFAYYITSTYITHK